MRKISCLFSSIVVLLFLYASAFAQSNLSLQELKEQYNRYKKIANDPDIFWIVTFDDNKGAFVGREKFEEMMMQKIMLTEGDVTLEKRVNAMARYINISQEVKADLRKNLLPDLEFQIKERENSSNPHTNSGNNTAYYPGNTASNDSSFADVVAELSSDEYLDDISFETFIASSNGGGTAIQDSQTGSYDGNWNEAINDNYSNCPKTKPDDRSSFRAYPNGQTSGGTYRHCAYFGNGNLKLEETYVNGKRDGLQTMYTWTNKYNFSYVSTRANYSNGKRNGLMDTYILASNGAVYRMRFTTYADGMRHGDSVQWYENGQTMKETNFFQGKAIFQNNYNKDGSFSYCTKWGSDRKPRDCKTGNIRH